MPASNPPTTQNTAGKRHRHLPHFDTRHTYQSVTFRQADSLPRDKLQQMEQELAQKPVGQRDRERRQRIEQWLDAGYGSCFLRHPDMAHIMQQALRQFDGQRYHLTAWCIMPNHVHVLLQTLMPLPKIIQSWKSYTGRWALSHAVELGLEPPGKRFWMRDYWDRYIRDERHYAAIINYIHANPVKAGLCQETAEWRWSSATEYT